MKKVLAFIVAAGIIVSAGVFFINNQNTWFENTVEDVSKKTNININ